MASPSELRAYRGVDHLLQPAGVERVVVLLEPRDLGRLGGLLDDLGRVVDDVARVVAHLGRYRRDIGRYGEIYGDIGTTSPA